MGTPLSTTMSFSSSLEDFGTVCIGKSFDDKGRNPKKISTKIVNMSLSPLTPLPLKAIVNKKIVNYGADFNPPTYCHDRE